MPNTFDLRFALDEARDGVFFGHSFRSAEHVMRELRGDEETRFVAEAIDQTIGFEFRRDLFTDLAR